MDEGDYNKRRAALSLLERALGEEDAGKRLRLARRALTLDDSCADAWGILGEAEEDDREAVRLFSQALSRAEATLGDEAKKAIRNEQKGDPTIDVRRDPAGPAYVRARAGLGMRLAAVVRGGASDDPDSDTAAATDHLVNVLRVDPEDEMDLSHLAISFLLERGDAESDKAARHILATHPCECVHHCFCQTLSDYRKFGGEDYRTRYSLAEAIASGPLVPPFLYGQWEIPDGIPANLTGEEVSLSMAGQEDVSEQERALILSASVAVELLPAWRASPSAQAWLKDTCEALSAHVGERMDDPAFTGGLEGTGVEGLARLLGIPQGMPESGIEVTEPPSAWGRAGSEQPPTGYSWTEARAGFLFWREREEEDVALSHLKDALQELIEDRLAKAGIEPQRGTAPFPNEISPVAGLLGEPAEGVSPLAYLAAYGTAGQVARLAEELLGLRIADFTLITDDPHAAAYLRDLGADVFEGEMNDQKE